MQPRPENARAGPSSQRPDHAGRLLAALLTGLTARQLTLVDIDQITARHFAHVDIPRGAQPIARAIAATHTAGRLFSIRTGERPADSLALARRASTTIRKELTLDSPTASPTFRERRSELQQLCRMRLGPANTSRLVRRLVEEERIITSRLEPTERAAARKLIRDGIAEERNRRLRLRASTLYSAYLNHLPEP